MTGGEGKTPYSPYADLPTNVYKGQTHIHTTRSDGLDTPDVTARAYRRAGYEWIVLTDHDVVTSACAIDGLLIISGAEQSVDDFLPGPRPHIVGFPLREGETSHSLEAVLGNAVSVVAHCLYNPGGEGHTGREIALANPGYTCFEVYNATADALDGGTYGEDVFEELLSHGHRVWAVAADDCHGVDWSGATAVYVFADALTEANVVAALRAGRFYTTQGPLLTIADDGVVFSVETSEPATIEFVGSTGPLQVSTRATCAAYRYAGCEGYVRARVTRDADGKIAWTNPIFR